MSQDVTKILKSTKLKQGSEEGFDRAGFRFGIQITEPLTKVLTNLNGDPSDGSLVDHEFKEPETSRYYIRGAPREHPKMKMRVWLYCVKPFSLLELSGSKHGAIGEERTWYESNGNEVKTQWWEIHPIAGMLPDGIYLDAELGDPKSESQNELVLVTNKRIKLQFWLLEDLWEKHGERGCTFEESSAILNRLKRLLVASN